MYMTLFDMKNVKNEITLFRNFELLFTQPLQSRIARIFTRTELARGIYIAIYLSPKYPSGIMVQVEQAFKNSPSLITISPLFAGIHGHNSMRAYLPKYFLIFSLPWTESTSRLQIVAISAS